MNRITSVVLDGFKGPARTYKLGARTLLTGPNGLGKSAVLEAVRYALTGEVPTGKSRDAVATYFSARGGKVELVDEDYAWIRRGIEVDHEKHEVSKKLELSENSSWKASPTLLDMREFLALSANKRREFVLELVGAGEVPPDGEIKSVIANAYARSIAGPAASEETLNFEKICDLPAKLRPVAAHWSTVWTVFSSYLGGKSATASEIFQTLTEAARVRKNSSQRDALDAKSASRELEAEAKGAKAAAQELEKRREVAKAASETFGTAREQAARRKQAAEAIELEGQDRAKLASRLELCEAAVVEDPGKKPKVDASPSEEADRLREEANAVQVRANKIMAQQRKLKEANALLNLGRDRLKREEEHRDELHHEPISQAVNVAAELREESFREHWNIKTGRVVDELLNLVDELAFSWNERAEECSRRLTDWSLQLRSAELECQDLVRESRNDENLEDLTRETGSIEAEAHMYDKANSVRIAEEREALQEWWVKANRAIEVQTEEKALRERYKATRTRHHELVENLEAMPDPPVRALKEDVEAAREALQEAEEAFGVLTAYHGAIARAKSNQVAEASWKAAEAACKAARETYVAEIVEPIKADIGAILSAAGRPEPVYLQLENDRGKPIFDLGWIVGNEKRSLSSISDGEALLYTVALALALGRESMGRRVLLIEAEPLDDFNLGELLEALASIKDEELLCLVATSKDPPKNRDGWKCFEFKLDGSLRTSTRRGIEEQGSVELMEGGFAQRKAAPRVRRQSIPS